MLTPMMIHVSGGLPTFPRFCKGLGCMASDLAKIEEISDLLLALALGKKVGSELKARGARYQGKIYGYRMENGEFATLIDVPEVGIAVVIRALDLAKEGGAGILWTATFPLNMWLVLQFHLEKPWTMVPPLIKGKAPTVVLSLI